LDRFLRKVAPAFRGRCKLYREVTQPGKSAQDTQSSQQAQQAPQSQQAQQQQPAPPANPMDEFNKLFAPQEAPSKQNPQEPQDAWVVNSDNLRSSSKAVGDALASVIPAEQMQAALQGDTQALGTILSNACSLLTWQVCRTACRWPKLQWLRNLLSSSKTCRQVY